MYRLTQNGRILHREEISATISEGVAMAIWHVQVVEYPSSIISIIIIIIMININNNNIISSSSSSAPAGGRGQSVCNMLRILISTLK